MILGSYRNPPYKSHRSPRQDSASVSPPPAPGQEYSSPNSSPKRKRIEELPGSGLRVETGFGSGGPDALLRHGGENSPRTKVAAKLEDLEIHQQGVSSQSPRKRVKRDAVGRSEVVTPLQRREPEREIPESGNANGMLEIGETPQVDGEEMGVSSAPSILASSSPPASPTDLQALRKSFGMTDTGRTSSSLLHHKRMPSPPPPTPRAPSSLATTISLKESSTFAPSLPHVNLSSLTWQDNEITGHELDPTSPDDDGEGINGVGFRPTAAMAWARSQKRRMQVEGWKNREAREARDRRRERRRGTEGGSSGGEREEMRGRRVRFEGEG
ncbi:uncharacterized protein RCC_09147 [Ramularia collo-cygni]|uniref:Uncharacterized protein n=1 Tax=Ramularia collo-cygni TaxID=112498 RepID=A0A2D3V635_9PEZI|nr:uncharacterized protein RCC_09147 [Ramularia collo-cygni]CZT23433.1 uncharacterized protein RCC_09147 [Ramularia collo-cygni]